METEKDLLWLWTELWSTLTVALIVYGGGLTANRVALSFVPDARDYLAGRVETLDARWPVLFRLWAATRVGHPFVVGALFALIPDMPRPEMIGTQTSAALWFGGAGMLNGQIFLLVDAVSKQLMKLVNLIVPWVRSKLGMPPSKSTPPGAPVERGSLNSDPDPSTETPIDPDAEREAMEAEVSGKVERK